MWLSIDTFLSAFSGPLSRSKGPLFVPAHDLNLRREGLHRYPPPAPDCGRPRGKGSSLYLTMQRCSCRSLQRVPCSCGMKRITNESYSPISPRHLTEKRDKPSSLPSFRWMTYNSGLINDLLVFLWIIIAPTAVSTRDAWDHFLLTTRSMSTGSTQAQPIIEVLKELHVIPDVLPSAPDLQGHLIIAYPTHTVQYVHMTCAKGVADPNYS